MISQAVYHSVHSGAFVFSRKAELISQMMVSPVPAAGVGVGDVPPLLRPALAWAAGDQSRGQLLGSLAL